MARTRIPGQVAYKSTGVNAPPHLGWTRFDLGSAMISDPLSQTASLVDDGDKLIWTSNSSVTIDSGANNQYPNWGTCYIHPVRDANGMGLTFADNFDVKFLIETKEATPADLQDTFIYYGLGIGEGFSTDISGNKCLGLARHWYDYSAGSNYVRRRFFGKNNHSEFTHNNQTWLVQGSFRRGPRYAGNGGSFLCDEISYDPTDTSGTGDSSFTSMNHGTSKITSTGQAYLFLTVGVSATISSAVAADFNIYYQVTGGLPFVP